MAKGLIQTDSLLEQEIKEQPDVLRAVLSEEWANIQTIAEAIRARSPSMVMIAARGSSDNAARYGKYLFGAANQLPVALATPSLFTRYATPPKLRDTLVLGISQSGQSQDVLAVVQEARRQGTFSLAITNDEHSPMAQSADHTIHLRAGRERSIAATKTYSASLYVLALLSVALNQDAAGFDLLGTIPGLAEIVLTRTADYIQAAEAYKEIQSCVVIGRGYNYGTAFEISLKLKELARLLAEPYSTADFQHGPVALVRDGFPILAVVTGGAVRDEIVDFLQSLQKRKPRVIVLGDDFSELEGAQTVLAPIPATPEWASPLLTVIPGQLFAFGLTLAKGLDPDHPEGLTKITITH